MCDWWVLYYINEFYWYVDIVIGCLNEMNIFFVCIENIILFVIKYLWIIEYLIYVSKFFGSFII